MKPHRLYREQIVPRPLAEVFEFFSRPENLARITPERLGFVILTPPPIVMKPGTMIEYQIRVFGVKLHWITEITVCEPPHRFVDRQMKGPYKTWHHTHTFKALDANRTLITDEVLYELPFGPLGLVPYALFVKKDVESIFEHRRQVIERLFGLE